MKDWIARAKPPPWTVTIIDGVIAINDGQGAERSILARDLRRVVVDTDDGGPWGEDVVFLLYSKGEEPTVFFPLEADGVHDFVGWLKALPGYRDREFAKAMSSTKAARFVIYERRVWSDTHPLPPETSAWLQSPDHPAFGSTPASLFDPTRPSLPDSAKLHRTRDAMIDLPDDIFTEPEDVDPNTLANLGPLTRLAGVWEGRKGVDLNPKADGPERRDFLERIEIHPIDPQANGPQLLYGLRYHVHIVASDEDTTFHDQVGYWLWEPATGLILQSLTIPRGQVALASGRAAPDGSGLIVRAERGGPGYGICSADFLEAAFRTDSYELDVRFNADGGWSYVSTTMLQVHGRTAPFRHIDVNTLTKVGEPRLNPSARIAAGETLAKAHGFTTMGGAE